MSLLLVNDTGLGCGKLSAIPIVLEKGYRISYRNDRDYCLNESLGQLFTHFHRNGGEATIEAAYGGEMIGDHYCYTVNIIASDIEVFIELKNEVEHFLGAKDITQPVMIPKNMKSFLKRLKWLIFG